MKCFAEEETNLESLHEDDFKASVRTTQVILGSNVKFKRIPSLLAASPDQDLYKSSTLIARQHHTSHSDIIIAGELSGKTTANHRCFRPTENHGSTQISVTNRSGWSSDPVVAAVTVSKAAKLSALHPS